MIDEKKLIARLTRENEEYAIMAIEKGQQGDERARQELLQRATGYADAIEMIWQMQEEPEEDEPRHDKMYNISKALYHLRKEYAASGVDVRPFLTLLVTNTAGRKKGSVYLDEVYKGRNDAEELLDSMIMRCIDDINNKENNKEGSD